MPCSTISSDSVALSPVSAGQAGCVAWLRNAAIGLCALAAAAASFTAQYRMVYADRRLAVVAGLEAAIRDAAALVFACLGVALALHGRRALRARALNVASVGASVFMNVIAAVPGWRSLAVWAMPPVAYALASDTLIGVIRSWVIARHKHLNVSLAADEVTPLAVADGLVAASAGAGLPRLASRTVAAEPRHGARSTWSAVPSALVTVVTAPNWYSARSGRTG
jgi:hypothetical protein